MRAVHPNGLCLPRSLALATYLAAIGLPAQVIVARERICTNPRYGFHSWTELHGEVLNDNQDVTLGFTVLQRVSASAVGVDSNPPRRNSRIPGRRGMPVRWGDRGSGGGGAVPGGVSEQA